MITKVVHGWRPAGLIAYLMGPGRAEEHVEPRVIASWDGLDAAWQPARTGAGPWDLDIGALAAAMRAPAVAAGLSERGDGKRGYVWHCSARLAPGDRELSDGEWAGIARELLDGAGVAAFDDPGGPRWFAVRHAKDHIHIAVVLVRQDTARRFWPYREYPRLRETARAIERRLGLTLTAAADGTAARSPSRGEIEKAARQGRVPARVELTRAVREAAVASCGVGEFIAALGAAGYLIKLRRAPSGDPIGFKVARPGDLSATGQPVFYSGSKIAPDLSLPKLRQRWADSAGGPAEASAAARQVAQARRAVVAARRGLGAEDADEIAHATGDVMIALRRWPGGHELGEAAGLFDRAARAPGRGVGRAGPSSVGLRRLARHLIRQRRGCARPGCGRRAGRGIGRPGPGDRGLAAGAWPHPPGRRRRRRRGCGRPVVSGSARGPQGPGAAGPPGSRPRRDCRQATTRGDPAALAPCSGLILRIRQRHDHGSATPRPRTGPGASAGTTDPPPVFGTLVGRMPAAQRRPQTHRRSAP